MAEPEDRTPVSITELPNELLTEIFSYLPLQPYVARVTRVSRCFRAIAEPLLYHTISTDWYSQNYIHEKKFRSVFRVLSRNPSLCSHVAVLHVKMWNLVALGCTDATEFVKLFPSLHELALDDAASDFRLPSLGRLVSLRISFDFWAASPTARHEQSHELGALAHVFSIPTLRKLQIDLISLDLDELGLSKDCFPRRCHRTSLVTDLHLIYWEEVHMRVLPEMLLLAKHLKRIVLDIQGEEEPAGCFATPLAVIDAALQPHASTLEEISITSTGGLIFPPPSLIGDFRRYTNLKRLGIPESLLVQHGDLIFRNSLPCQLEEIQLQYNISILSTPNNVDLSSWWTRMNALAKDKHACFPALKFVACWDRRFTDEYMVTRKEGGLLDEMENLVCAFKDVGVRFSCVAHPSL
ncbi:MAG: hypothetical protein Q9187_002250 [Circinaria calcarea]